MDLSDTADMNEFRASVRSVIRAWLPEGWAGAGALSDEECDDVRQRWRAELVSHGWLAPAWPTTYGGAGLSPCHEAVLMEEIVTHGLPTGSDSDDFGIMLLGNTMLREGPEELCREFLPRILSGEDVWSQGFSEPGAGSDLASLRTKATLSDGVWSINGQKLWSSGAHKANWMFVLARTDVDVPGHRGLSLLLVPLDQPGVTVRPVPNLTGDPEFNEVFFDDAVTREDLVVGGVGRGWPVAMTLLGFERGATAFVAPLQFRDELGRLVELAKDNGAWEDGSIRRNLAWCQVRVEQMECQRLATVQTLEETDRLGPEAAVFKLLWSEYHVELGRLAMKIMGSSALVLSGRPSRNWYRTDDVGTPNETGTWGSLYLNAHAGRIYGGTSQVQRTIVGERLLNLPR